MKNISPPKPKSSSLTRIMKNGHKKTRYKQNSGDLLMQLSENDHKRIAKLISEWLEQQDKN